MARSASLAGTFREIPSPRTVHPCGSVAGCPRVVSPRLDPVLSTAFGIVLCEESLRCFTEAAPKVGSRARESARSARRFHRHRDTTSKAAGSSISIFGLPSTSGLCVPCPRETGQLQFPKKQTGYFMPCTAGTGVSIYQRYVVPRNTVNAQRKKQVVKDTVRLPLAICKVYP